MCLILMWVLAGIGAALAVADQAVVARAIVGAMSRVRVPMAWLVMAGSTSGLTWMAMKAVWWCCQQFPV